MVHGVHLQRGGQHGWRAGAPQLWQARGRIRAIRIRNVSILRRRDEEDR